MSERISRREILGSAAAGAAAFAIVGCQPTAKRDESAAGGGGPGGDASQPAGLDRAKVGDWTAMIHKASGADAVEVKFSQKLVRRQRFTTDRLGGAGGGKGTGQGTGPGGGDGTGRGSIDTVRIRAIVGEKRGEAIAESFDEAALAAAAKKAAEAATIADAPAALPKVEPQFYPILPTDRFETRRVTTERLAADADALRRILADAGVAALGDISTSLEAVGVGTSYGITAFERRTEARLELRIGEGPGQLAVSQADRSIDDLGAIEALRALLPLVAGAKDAAPLPTGEFPVIFAPAATASLMRLVTRSIADTPDAVNSSVLADRLGQSIVDSRLTLRHRPDHPALLGCSFDDDGLASEFHTWIDKGVLRRLRAGRGRSEGLPMPAPHAWMLSYEGTTAAAAGPGGAATLLGGLDELIAATPRGLVVLDFAVLATTQGADLPLLAARVGGPALVIDDGKIVGGVTGVALEESVLSLFNRIDAATQPLPALDVTRSQKWLAPAIRVTDVACGVA